MINASMASNFNEMAKQTTWKRGEVTRSDSWNKIGGLCINELAPISSAFLQKSTVLQCLKINDSSPVKNKPNLIPYKAGLDP